MEVAAAAHAVEVAPEPLLLVVEALIGAQAQEPLLPVVALIGAQVVVAAAVVALIGAQAQEHTLLLPLVEPLIGEQVEAAETTGEIITTRRIVLLLHQPLITIILCPLPFVLHPD